MIIKPEGLKKRFFIVYFYGRTSPRTSFAGVSASMTRPFFRINSTRMIDLHMHSNCSDGTLSPEELAAAALNMGLEAAALTDHDTVSGVERFLAAAAGTPLRAVPGVELASMLFNKDIHIVGLFIDPRAPVLLSALERMRLWREERNVRMVDKIGRAHV